MSRPGHRPRCRSVRGTPRRFGIELAASRGQASVLLVAGLAAILVGALVLGVVARGVAREAGAQRAADLAALAGARAMHAAYPRLFEPPTIEGRPNPRHLDKDRYLATAREAAEHVAEANGADATTVAFPDGDTFAPVRIRVGVHERIAVERNAERRRVAVDVVAEAELAPATADVLAEGGGYDGPLAYRQGKPMRPDVAHAFDRMERAARAEGVTLLIDSAYRSDAEQAVLFRAHPDPKWVAPPGTSLHRYATELDLGRFERERLSQGVRVNAVGAEQRTAIWPSAIRFTARSLPSTRVPLHSALQRALGSHLGASPVAGSRPARSSRRAAALAVESTPHPVLLVVPAGWSCALRRRVEDWLRPRSDTPFTWCAASYSVHTSFLGGPRRHT